MLMKKIILAAVFILASSTAMAQYIYNGSGIVTGNVYLMPAAPVVVQQPPVVVQQPVVVEKQVVVQPRPVCTTYPDPWDTLGYIFGDPFMITTCY
jgi:hypothetical protein